MYFSDANRFARPFAEVWQHLPFEPSASLAQFLSPFIIAGRFDADRFWEFVAAGNYQRPGFTRAEPASTEN